MAKKSPAIESVRTTGRLAVLGAVGVIVTWGLSQLVPNLPVEVVAAVLTLIAVAYDRYAYVADKRVKMPF